MNSLKLVLIALVSALCMQLNAQQVAKSFAGGTGTQDDPYVITDISHLRYLAERVNNGVSFKGKYIVLANDIRDNDKVLDEDGYLVEDTSGLRIFNKIGGWGDTKNLKFMGTFDGQGYSICGIYAVNSEVYNSCIFTYAEDAKIQNVCLRDSYIDCWIRYFNNSTISNCYNYAYTYCGFIQEGTGVMMKNCGNYGNGRRTGLGYRLFHNCKLVNCFNVGNLESDEWGGAGLVDQGHDLMNCFNGGNKMAQSQTAGLVRWIRNISEETTHMSNCVNYGRVEPFTDGWSGVICSTYGQIRGPSGNAETELENIYWLETSHANTMAPKSLNYAKLINKGDYLKMDEDEMKSDAFLEKLNANAKALGQDCCGWKRGKDGFPVLEIVNYDDDKPNNAIDIVRADSSDSDSPSIPRYFNMQGIEVSNPTNGIYIRVVDGIAHKVLF